MHKNLPSGGESERVGDVRRRMVFVQSVKSALVGRLRESHAGEPMFREVRVYGGGVYRVTICHNKMREKINFEVLSCTIEGCPL